MKCTYLTPFEEITMSFKKPTFLSIPTDVPLKNFQFSFGILFDRLKSQHFIRIRVGNAILKREDDLK